MMKGARDHSIRRIADRSYQAPSTIYQTSTICKTHYATLTATQFSTVVNETTEYNTVTAAPSTITKSATLTINSVLTEVSLLPADSCSNLTKC